MSIFSNHRKKLDPRRRYGMRSFQDKIKEASNYKRTFEQDGVGFLRFSRSYKGIYFFALIVLLSGIGYLMFSNKFAVTEISVAGNHQISSEQIQAKLSEATSSRLFLVKKNNFFLMSRGRVSELLIGNMPTIKEITAYKRSWPNKVSLEVTERMPGFVIESGGLYFLVDDEGVVVSQIDDKKNFLVAHDQVVENFARGEVLANEKLTIFILSMSRSWPTKIQAPISEVKFPGKGSLDVEFVTTTGWRALFDTTRPVSVQLAALSVILNKEVKPGDLPRLAYVDLRLSKWAYYCFKQSPCQQQEQIEPETAGTNTIIEPK